MAAMSGPWLRKNVRHPGLGGQRRLTVLGDARLRDLKTVLEQFTVNAWRNPQRIFDAHPSDRYLQLCVDLRSPPRGRDFPTPVAAKAGLVQPPVDE
jgi:hypothetical protein